MANQIKKRNGYKTCWWFSTVTNRVTNRILDGGNEHLSTYNEPGLLRGKKWNLFDAFTKNFRGMNFLTASMLWLEKQEQEKQKRFCLLTNKEIFYAMGQNILHTTKMNLIWCISKIIKII